MRSLVTADLQFSREKEPVKKDLERSAGWGVEKQAEDLLPQGSPGQGTTG